MKAKATGFKVKNRQYSTIVEYEYRGKKYEVEYANDFTYYVTSPKVQHEQAQAMIDKELDSSNVKKEYRYEDTAEYGFELFWEYVEGKGYGSEEA